MVLENQKRTETDRDPDRMRIALIPAYEPDEKLIQLTTELKDAGFALIIVDDGSGPAYQDIFKQCEANAEIISYDTNRGKGAAMKEGFSYILEYMAEPFVVVTVDADGQHRVPDVCCVCDEAIAFPEALILGSRKFEDRIPLRSRFGNTVTRWVYRLFSGIRIHDTQTGLRAFTDRLIVKMLQIPGERYEYEMNVLMLFAREKIEMKEVWIETIYLNNNDSSHFHTCRDSFRIYREILKFSASSFVSFLLDYILYCAVFNFSSSVILSNLAARLISASVNFNINRKLVFDSEVSLIRSAVRYALLAVFILLCNTMILSELVYLGVNAYAAKLITETLMFVISWLVQRSLIFRKRKGEEE